MARGDANNGRAMRDADGVALLPLASSARRIGATPGQALVVGLLACLLVAAFVHDPARLALGLVQALQFAFVATAAWRLLLMVLCRRPPEPPPAPALPRYTVIAALHDEAAVVPQLVRRLAAIDYPADRLEGFLALEAHDAATIAAAEAAPRPAWLHILIVPPGAPKTKPRALNFALARASGDLVTVYDAEDQPDPGQLREAAARFTADRTGRLACLQAPLRIRLGPDSGFIDRQFAAEYASLFEVTLPALSRLGLPFPLGGTSNHFRVDVLRRIGAWDAWNVTEDADLGFRLWATGHTLGVINRPTLESPPGGFEHWLPQRTRWLKGYMQTWGVHTRRPLALGLRGALALMMTVGAGLAAAAAHGPALAWFATTLLVAAAAGLPPATPILALAVLLLGAGTAWASCLKGSRRSGGRYTVGDMARAPIYWAMLSLAFAHALWRLVREPFAWDKTAHRPDAD